MNDLPPLVKREIEEKEKIVGASKIEQEAWRKKNVGDAMDMLDDIGSPDEKKGIRKVKEAYDQYRKEEFAKKSDRILWLNQKSKYSKGKRIEYYKNVETLLKYELSYLKLPHGYSVKSEVTIRGVKIVLHDRWDRIYIGGFTPTGLGLYDEQACRTSINKVDDMIGQLEQNPPNGIFLP